MPRLNQDSKNSDGDNGRHDNPGAPAASNIVQDEDLLQKPGPSNAFDKARSKKSKDSTPKSSSEQLGKNVDRRQDQNRHAKRKFDKIDVCCTETNVNLVSPTVQNKEPRSSCSKTFIDLTLDSENEAVEEIPAKKIKRMNCNVLKKSDSGACQNTNSLKSEEKSKLDHINLSSNSNKKVNDKPSSSLITNESHPKAKRKEECKHKYISERRILKRIKKIIDFDDDSDTASGPDIKKDLQDEYINDKRTLERIKKVIDFVDDSDTTSGADMKKKLKHKYISEKRILKRIKKVIDFEEDLDDDRINANITATEKLAQIKDSEIVNEEMVFDIAKIKNHSEKTIELHIGHQECQDQSSDAELCDMVINIGHCADNLSCALQPITANNHSPCNKIPENNHKLVQIKDSEIVNEEMVFDIAKIKNHSEKTIELHIGHQECQDQSSDAEFCDMVINVGHCANNLSCALQPITENNHSPCKKSPEKNLNCMPLKGVSDKCNITDAISNIKNTEAKHKINIRKEESSIVLISSENLSDMDMDVLDISDDSNNSLITDKNQFKEKNNSLPKNGFSNFLNSETVLDNNNDLCQLKENISVPSNDLLDIGIKNNVDNINVSKSISIKKQVENKTRSPVSQSHCSNDGSSSKAHTCYNALKKQLNGPLSKSNSNNNILTDTISKNKNTKEKSNTHSMQNIEPPIMQNCNVVASNIKQKNTDSKIISPQVERLSILPTTTNSYGQKIFRFFWLDAYEDSYTDPGVVFLFGKILEPTANQYISSCVTVKNIPRRMYVLPRKDEAGEQSAFDKAYVELNEYLRQKCINEFKCKKVTKIYAFEKKDVPQNTAYLEVRYSSVYPALDSDYSGPAIQAIFGTNVTAMELFLIEKNIKGPCWMDVKISPFASSNLSSWCKFEINCTRMEDISVTNHQQTDPSITPIAVAALSIQVSLDEKLQKYDIASIGIAIQEHFHLYKGSPQPLFNRSYCLVSQCSPWPKFAKRKFAKWKDFQVILCESEINLLERLLQLLQSLDPDILIGYDTNFEFDILVRKIMSLGTTDWSRIGKLRRSVPPKFKGRIYLNQVLCGRPICDVQRSMSDFQFSVTNYDLASLYSSTLSKDAGAYTEIKPDECLQYYTSLYNMTLLVKSTMTKVSYIFEVSAELSILSLAVQITRIVGNTLSRTLSCGVGERNEFLLLHAFQSKNYLTPDKRKDNSDYDGKKKSSYTGGMILEPKAGFYDTSVLLLDFNSLYPSIIQEFNICFTTIPGAAHASVDELCRVESCAEQGILPTIISGLVQSRLQIKKMINSPNLSSDLRRQYNSRQLALKLTANSMYGCLGASYSRFYAKGLAALVAMRGREIFKKTQDLIQSHNYEVIYGDTDSFMINVKLTDYEQVMAVDRVFKCLLLMKKKQYAGLIITRQSNDELEYKKEIKGLEIIRRDCCALASDTGHKVLEELLKDQPSHIRSKNIFEILETTNRELREGKLPMSSLEITKKLSKDPDKYPNKNHPHVIVAERLNKINARKWKAGDVVSYIICKDNTTRKPLERAYHIEEFKTNEQIKIDETYYLMYHIFPIIHKICDPIEGIENVLIAQSLGIADLYKPKKISDHRDAKMPLSLHDNRNKNCVPLQFKCRDCKTKNKIKTSVIHTKSGCQPSLATCTNSKCNTPPWKYPHFIQNQLQLAIRECVNKYYTGAIECSNPLCCNSTRIIHLNSDDGLIKCYDCFDGRRYRKYSEIDLHNQLTFFVDIFTLDEAACQGLDVFTAQEVKEFYTGLREFMLDQIDSNAYSIVDLSRLFTPNSEPNKDDDLESELI
ncbi:DNA polymerase alpha catalytic subunit-like isoform X2 [Nasonia vitripennis]|uniref:DNA polymerase n=1 Tax=Nasonia vitripennis TaxID=7425 RepID=A0A7M7HC95_NASVI|nr:DNA polymerase alpha catalytic subunit-like isoform X2 [Nasonia vitripennis]